LRGFCPWSTLKQPHRGHFAGFLPLVKPESCPEVMFYGVFAFSGLFRGYVAWILEHMGPGFWKIWDRILQHLEARFGGNGAANRFLAYL